MAEAVAIVLDVGPYMQHGSLGQNTALQSAVECLKMLIQRKLFAEKKDEYCLILCGTEVTSNELADNEGNFENISMVRPLARISWDLLEFLNQGIDTTQTPSDVIDGVIVAVDHLIHQVKGKKGIDSKRVLLISNLGGDINCEQIARIIKNLKKAEVELNLIGYELDLYDDYGSAKNDNDDVSNRRLDGAAANPDSPLVKTKTPTQLKNADIIKEILKALGGESYTFDEIIPALSNFETRGILQRGWKVDLEVGDSLNIPVNAYTKVKEAKPKSMLIVGARDPEARLRIDRSYHKGDEAQTEVDLEDTVKGFRYGSTLVPFSEEDMDNMKLQVEKSLKILGFTKAKNVPRHLYMGDSVMVLVADGEGAGPAISALVRALFSTNRVAVCRRVYNRATAPRLGVLTPANRAGCDCLEYSELVYAEDLGTFPLPGLPVGPAGGEEPAHLGKYRPSEGQLSAIDELIDAMMLHVDRANSSTTNDNDEEAVGEQLKPCQLVNPYIQHLYQSSQHRAFNPTAPLPGPSASLLQSLEPPAPLADRASPVVDQLATLFRLTRREKEKRKLTAGELFKEEEGESSAKRARTNEEETSSGDLSGGLSSLVRGNVTEVGSVDPVADFEAMVDRGLFKEAANQMTARIMQLVTDSYQDHFYPKAMACLLALRSASIRLDQPTVGYNTFLRSWRADLDRPGSHRQDFWTKIVRESMGLINSDEASSSGVSRAEADTFLAASSSSGTPGADHTDDQSKEDVDDLLAEMD